MNFTIPLMGFTPPLNAGTAGVAPDTVTTGGFQYDNSPSRLNVAKAGIASKTPATTSPTRILR